jgi:hypothetical protein
MKSRYKSALPKVTEVGGALGRLRGHPMPSDLILPSSTCYSHFISTAKPESLPFNTGTPSQCGINDVMNHERSTSPSKMLANNFLNTKFLDLE